MDDTMRGESHMGVRKFWRGVGFDPRGHHGMGALEKCHYNFLATLLFVILLWIKKDSIHSVEH